jgi:3-methylcrotonyl-CoA carboxylase alpha subunit
MIAKVIVYGHGREDAVEALSRALRDAVVWPVKTNAGFILNCLEDEDFRAGNVSTAFIPAKLDTLVPPPSPGEAEWNLAAAALSQNVRPGEPSFSSLVKAHRGNPWWRAAGFRLNRDPERRAWIAHENEVRAITSSQAQGEGAWTRHGDQIIVTARGQTFAFALPSSSMAAGGGAAAADGAVISPMPGKIIAVEVRQGDAVTKGQKLVTLEAMKMEHSLTAPFDGVVAELNATEGGQVTEGTLLARIEKV